MQPTGRLLVVVGVVMGVGVHALAPPLLACPCSGRPAEVTGLRVARQDRAAVVSWDALGPSGCTTYTLLASEAPPVTQELAGGLDLPSHVDTTPLVAGPVRYYLVGAVSPAGPGPTGRDHAWDGSWTPAPTEFPLVGLLDDEYFDGHLGRTGQPTPILPPGDWDWDDGNDDLANWRNFATNIGGFARLEDAAGDHYGWELVPNEPGAVDFAGGAAYFGGSSGVDVLDLGLAGVIHSMGNGNLGEGPDVLVFNGSWSLDYRTGGSSRGGERDDDLVVAGCDENPDGSWDITTTTIHTGPGQDLVFVRDLDRAAVDLGNGADGRTDTIDPMDGPDRVVLRGNTHDFRVFGGNGDDTAFWFVDDNVQVTGWLGPNFFGAGGADPATWDDAGVDRLVLVTPADTAIVTALPPPPGSLGVRATDGSLRIDGPTVGDPFATYCNECGTGPGGRKTVILEYVSADSSVRTGYFYLTAFEELQVGLGPGARTYRIDDVNGSLEEDTGLAPCEPPPFPTERCR